METSKVITPYFENGVFDGVRVTLGDEDFVNTFSSFLADAIDSMEE